MRLELPFVIKLFVYLYIHAVRQPVDSLAKGGKIGVICMASAGFFILFNNIMVMMKGGYILGHFDFEFAPG